jgi:hypothetical protein
MSEPVPMVVVLSIVPFPKSLYDVWIQVDWALAEELVKLYKEIYGNVSTNNKIIGITFKLSLLQEDFFPTKHTPPLRILTYPIYWIINIWKAL